MNYLDTAFSQLELSIKLMRAGEQGMLKRKSIDLPLTIAEKNSVLVLSDQTLLTDDDLISALQNNVLITFGAAAITLNRCREENGYPIPDPINTELEQWIALVYQIRNAFAHDISEPTWVINHRYARSYEIGYIKVDLTALNGGRFNYNQLGGLEVLFLLKDFGKEYLFKA